MARVVGLVALVASSVVLSTAAADPSRDFGQVNGYRRDSSGIYPDAKPPTELKHPGNLRWEAQIPGWGEGSPVVVGGKVFLMSEPAPDKYWPELLCYSLADGKLLWSKELDSAEAMFPNDEAKRNDATAKWKQHVDALRAGIMRRWDYLDLTDPAEKKAALAKAEELGYRVDRRFGGIHLGKVENPAEEFGFNFGGWYPNYPSVIGIVYPTPVTDGKHIYVTTWHGLVACFDLDGNRQWLTHQRVDLPKVHNCGCSGARSPIIYKNLLISDLGDAVYAFDRATGEMRWSDEIKCSTIVSPGILTVPTGGGGTADVLWAAGAQVYLLPEGKRLKLDGWNPVNHGTMTLVKYDEPDVVFIDGQGEHCGWTDKGKCDQPPPAALRCKLEGDTLKVTVLWTGLGGEQYKGSSHCPNMVYYGGKLFFPGKSGVIFDALTGDVVAGDPKSKKNNLVADTHHMLKIANGKLYGLKGSGTRKGGDMTPGAIMQVSTPEGKIIATSKIPELPLNDADRAIIRQTSSQWKSGSKGWGTFAYSGSDTFTFGPDCTIIRGNARLYCFGKETK